MPRESFDSESVALMGKALDAAWHELRSSSGMPVSEAAEIKTRMAERILVAVANGERDVQALKGLALELSAS